ncbi:MAG: M48 family metalloprotease [Rickettsiales bacterium]|nr:M48 family metalloprotease [Rickettsiales bacterium]
MIKKLLITILAAQIYLASSALAQISLIRDAQTEKFLRDLSNPIFKAANLNPNDINIYIVNDNAINAFVSGGQNMFINIGLITKFDTPDTLIGVVAHETGHIKAGHLARSYEAYEKAQTTMILSYLLGIGAVIAGAPDAGMAAITGGQDAAVRLYLKFNRSQEEAADYHAIEYLDKIKYPSSGLVKLLQYFNRQSIGYEGQINEYLLTHPVSKKRVDLILDRTKNNNFSNKIINSKLQRQMDVVIKKLEGFTTKPQGILKKYQHKNQYLDNYIKAIAYFRDNQLSKSLNLLDPLINSTKNQEEKGFLYELKGQILFENGQINDSIIAYNAAIKNLNDEYSAQAKISFATAILNLHSTDKELLGLATKNLEEAKIFEKNTPFLFKQLSQAYNKLNHEGKSYLALAEYNLLIREKEKATKYAKKAKDKLSKNDKINLLRAEDIIELSKKKK